MARLKLLSFSVRGKPQKRWYDFELHRFVKSPKRMFRLSIALNDVPKHHKYRSYLLQVWSLDREFLEDNFDGFLNDFIRKVGKDLESVVYAEELVDGVARTGEHVVTFGYGIQEVVFDEKLEGESRFEIEHH